MTTLSAITAALVTALAVDLGTFDLSGTDSVKRGTFSAPPISGPFAAIRPAEQLASEQQACGAWYLEELEILVDLWAPQTGDTTTDAAARAEALQAEAKAAIDAARFAATALGRCVRFACAGVTLDPAAADAPMTWARSQLRIELTYRRTPGT